MADRVESKQVSSARSTAVRPVGDDVDLKAELAWSGRAPQPYSPPPPAHLQKKSSSKCVSVWRCFRRCLARPEYGNRWSMSFDMSLLVVLSLTIFETTQTYENSLLHDFLAGPGRGKWSPNTLEHKRDLYDWLFDAYVPEASAIASPYNQNFPPHPRMNMYNDFPIFFPQGLASVFQVRRKLPKSCSSERMRVKGKGVDSWQTPPSRDPYEYTSDPALEPERMRHMYLMMGLNCSAKEYRRRPYGSWVTDNGEIQKDTCPFSDFTEYLEVPLPSAGPCTGDDDAGVLKDSGGSIQNCSVGATHMNMCSSEKEEDRRWFRSKCCQSCSLISSDASSTTNTSSAEAASTCSSDDVDRLSIDTQGQMTTCEWGVSQGYCTNDPDWASTPNWFATVCCKSCSTSTSGTNRRELSENEASSTPTSTRVKVGLPQSPFRPIELMGSEVLNSLADTYREMVIPGAASKHNASRGIDDIFDDPLEVVFFRLELGTKGSTNGWKEALLKCGWIDPLTELVVVRAPILVSSTMTFGVINHAIYFSPFGKVKSIKKRITLTSLDEYLINSGSSSGEGWSLAHETPGLTARYVIYYSYAVVMFMKSYWALSGLFITVHRHCCFCRCVCCTKCSEALHRASGETSQERVQRRKSAAQVLRHSDMIILPGSWRWIWWKMKRAMSVTLLLDVVMLSSYFMWTFTTARQNMASVACVNHIAEMGRKAETSGADLGMNGITLWLQQWGQSTEDILDLGLQLNARTLERATAQMFFFIVMFGELLRHFSNDPHFAIVPRSLAYAAKDIFFLVIVLCFMILIFATMLGGMYGQVVPAFSTMKGALLEVVMMTLGEWSDAYYAILDVTDYKVVWTTIFVLYNLIVIVVTMNVFLSIVLYAYSVVKDYMAAEEAAKVENATEGVAGKTSKNTLGEKSTKSGLKPQRSMMQMVQDLKARRRKINVDG